MRYNLLPHVSMAKRNDIPPEVAALTAQYLETDEVIHSWHWVRVGYLSAHLIRKELKATCEELERRRGRGGAGGGCGRTLEFVCRGDQWEFAGEGGWIS